VTSVRLKAAFRTALPYLAFAAVALGFLNFLWFMSETLPLNLIPSDGRVTAGHYFLWSKVNGGYVEVSRSFFEWVRFHEPTLFLSWPLVMMSMGYIVFAQLSGKIGGQTSPIVASERVRQVRDSGPLVTSTRSAGVVGSAWFSRPLVRIEIYPGGVVLKPLFMAERAILAGEISRVSPQGGLSARSVPDRHPVLGYGVAEVSSSYRPRGQFVEIEHAGIGMASPLMILGSGNWDIAQAISIVADAARAPIASDVLIPAQGNPMALPISRSEGLPALVTLGFNILGIIVTVALLWSGFAWAIPQLGLFGVAWTAVGVLIAAGNVRRLFIRRHG
jgi:hypothetical protein